MNLRMLLCLAVGFLCCTVAAQEEKKETKPFRFEKITTADFKTDKTELTDSLATGAVIIADVGKSSFQGNSKGWFSLVFSHHKRIKILDKNGFDAANFDIHLYYKKQDEEKLDDLKATTYNLENGTVVETRLESSSIYKDKLNDHFDAVKFAMPAVKVGSIIDVEYTIISDFMFNLQPWAFQGNYPRLWSEYTVDMPEFFNYVVLFQGYQPLFDKSVKSIYNNFNLLEPTSDGSQQQSIIYITATVNSTRWIMKNVPALKKEPYTTSLKNHISSIEFQQSQYRFPHQEIREIMPNWPKVAERLMKSEVFGHDLLDPNNWMKEDLLAITAGSTNKLEEAQKIFAWVRDHFTCTKSNSYLTETPLKTVFKNKSGNIAEINLLLTAMLLHQNIYASPVILSTRENGFVHNTYPLLDRYNYVVCEAIADGKTFYLDAAEPALGFGMLNEKCYNGQATVIGRDGATATHVYFYADSLKETKMTSIFISSDEKGGWSGNFSNQLGLNESLQIRNEIRKSGQEEYVKKIKSQAVSDIQLGNIEFDSLIQYNYPITIKYDFNTKFNGDDIVLFNPMIGEGYKENPFKAIDRFYPVEMPYATDKIFVANIEAPKGYVIDELPKSVRLNLNGNDGYFEYLASINDNTANIRCRLNIKKANFFNDDYQTLRDFFAYVVKKESEQIVFKKVK